MFEKRERRDGMGGPADYQNLSSPRVESTHGLTIEPVSSNDDDHTERLLKCAEHILFEQGDL